MTRPQQPWARPAATPTSYEPAAGTAGPQVVDGLPVDPPFVDSLWDTTALGWLTAPASEDEQPDADATGADVVVDDVDVTSAEQVGAGGEAGFELMFAGVEQWVCDILAPTFPRRATPQFRWCAQWWRHPEAVLRLEALWRSWEASRGELMVGIAGWLRDHLDPQLAVLTGPAGPFCECDPTRHFDPAEPALPLQPAPDGWWDTPDPEQENGSAAGSAAGSADFGADLGADGGAALEVLDLIGLDLLEHDGEQAGPPALGPARGPAVRGR